MCICAQAQIRCYDADIGLNSSLQHRLSGCITTMMWLLPLITSILISESLCCITCDQRGKDAMETLTILIQSHLPEDLEAGNNITQIYEAAERKFLDYLGNEVGMMDTFAISTLVSEYQKSVDTINATEVEEELILEELISEEQLIPIIKHHFQDLMEKTEVIIQDLEKRKCPNKQGEDSCGLMVQTFIKCNTCAERKVVCAGGPPENQEYFDRSSCLCTQDKCVDLKTGLSCSPCVDLTSQLNKTLNCGVENIQVSENEDLILDCGQEWHAMLEGSYQYQFIEKTDTEPVVTNNFYLNIQGAQMGVNNYTCTTILDSGIPVSTITYSVRVVNESEGMAENQSCITPTPMVDMKPPEPSLDEALGMKIVDIGAISAAAIVLLMCCICGYIFYRLMATPKQPVEKEPV
ncbi:izumo sperm-egg fusion protein 1-like isoform X3 [Hyla sarda]|uniref:izumo sperm-egg fusion protein 1-like isoform X3 n=1 Tax=Hyla sarda TaxID=327740 RepID=UPI0024C27B25|nr:izumo sperm-egg fusion protein 1-like isoform X3 [Hyla sarda]